MQIAPKSAYQIAVKGLQLQVGKPDALWLNLLTLDFDNEDQLDFIRTMQQNYKGYLAYLRLKELIKECELIESAIENFAGSFGRHSMGTPEKLDDPDEIRSVIAELIELASVEANWELPDGIHHFADKFVRASQELAEMKRKWSMQGMVEKYKAEHSGYVYLFKLSTGHYKIGFSNNPQRRGREIVSGLPLTIELIHQIASNQIACLEDELHRRFQDRRYESTEWFTLTDDDVQYICGIAEQNFEWVNNPEWDEFYQIVNERRRKEHEEMVQREEARRAQWLASNPEPPSFLKGVSLGSSLSSSS